MARCLSLGRPGGPAEQEGWLCADPGRAGEWHLVQCHRHEHRQQEVDNVSGYRADTGGFVGGYDHLITDNFRLGGAIGYGISSISDLVLSDHNAFDLVNGLIYGAFTGTNWYANVVGDYGALHYDQTRNINFDGFSDTTGASRSGSLYSGHVDGGYAFVTPWPFLSRSPR